MNATPKYDLYDSGRVCKELVDRWHSPISEQKKFLILQIYPPYLVNPILSIKWQVWFTVHLTSYY